MKVLDLFSGIGGFSLGLERAGMETVAFCEIDPLCREQLAKNFPGVYVHDDIHTLKGSDYAADVICGGFPCQPYSVNGKRNPDDDRLLWPEMLRVIRESRDVGGGGWIIGENVNGIDDMGALDGVLSDLETLGYKTWPFVIPAGACPGTDHERKRVWIIAHDSSHRRERCGPGEIQRESIFQGDQDGRRVPIREDRPNIFKPGSRFGTNGVPSTLARLTPRQKWQLKCLGNAVHPYIPEMIGRAIMQIERDL